MSPQRIGATKLLSKLFIRPVALPKLERILASVEISSLKGAIKIGASSA
jgi:hypothetical protein